MQQMFIEFMIRENKGMELKQVEDKNIPGTSFQENGIFTINKEQKIL